MHTTVIRNGHLFDGQSSALQPVDILIQGSVIERLGAHGMAVPEGTQEIDAQGKILHAGLINSHTHGHGNLARGMGDRWTLELLLTAGPWISGNRSEEDKFLTTQIGACEMLLKGCTSCYDLTYEFPGPSLAGLNAAKAAYESVGLRALIAPMVADMTLFEAIPGLLEALPDALRAQMFKARLSPIDTTLQTLREIAHAWSGQKASDLVRLALAPTIPHHCTDNFLKGCLDIATTYGLGLHSHVSESKVQAVVGMRRYGKTLTAHLNDLGLIGPNFTVAHGVWLDDDDMRILADHGASVAHNPGSNMKLGSGIADFKRMLELGVNVGIGTDGSNSSDHQNMYEAMRLSSVASKVRGNHWPQWITAQEVFHAATCGSAKAIGLGDDVGKVAPGYKADIVFLDRNSINLIPLNNITNSLVYAEDGRSVDTVMVNGRIVVQNGKLLHVDLAQLARKAESAVERLQRANANQAALFKQLEPLVGSFCPSLAAQPYHIQRFGSCSCGGSNSQYPRYTE